MKTTIFGQALPNNNQIFYSLFNKGASTSYDMAALLYQATGSNDLQDQKMNFNHISRLKEKASGLKHQVLVVSGKAFISPFSRDDMYALASSINSVSDFIDIAARRINFYNIQVIAPIKELAGIIVDSCTLLVKCVEAMNDLSQGDIITGYCTNIKQLEHYADQVYNKALAYLLDNETDALEVMKYSEVFAALERATDKCEHVVNVIESIIIKNT
ncbi:DUF47 domain-containing protein [Mucilaginibacter agri]|uniref:DUF47 family protein n=1 Tax=Mucilaginibacter agri TaxID=2695265 RepID=A0A966DS07_9SPHI|nr:DUF47 family protein [Mucilaginibacter agri]NCD69638.1 DUF47 family protein [Mucilaginibacter agri]